MWAHLEPAVDFRAVGRGCTRRKPAFTLVELVVSLGVMSVLAVGISSAVLVSLRSVETSDSQSARIRQAADVSNQMAAELSTALDVSEKTDRAITFSVPDRDNDGNSEEIRYSWSAVAGDPLLRRINAQADSLILRNVHAFRVLYDLVPVPIPATGSDLLLAAHTSSHDLASVRIGASQWASQSFRVALPAGATGWKPTRVEVYCRSTGDTGGQITAQLCSALSDGRPGWTVYCQSTTPEKELRTAYSWSSFSLPCSGYYSPYAAVAVVLKSTIGESCELRFQNKNVTTANYCFSITTNAGGTWSIRTGQGTLFEIYGLVVGTSSDSNSEMRLGTVRWELQAGPDSAARVQAGAQTVNLPE